MIVGFLAWTISLGATAIYILGRAPMSRQSAVPHGILVALLAIAVVGTILTALLHTQTIAGVLPPGRTRSTAGELHDLGAAAILLVFAPAVLLSTLLVREPRWFRSLSLTVVLLTAAAGLAAAIAPIDLDGARQRAQLIAGCGWQMAC